MSDLCFKNMGATYNGQNYYADSISISESAPMQEIKTLGNSNSTSYMANPVEGTVSMSSYITTGTEYSNLTGQLGKTGFKEYSAGPLSFPESHLTSYSIEGSAGELLKTSTSYTYYGAMISGGAGGGATKGNVDIQPAHGGMSTLTLGDPADDQTFTMHEISDFSYSVEQSYEVTYALGSLKPTRVKMTEGSITLEVNGPTDSTDWSTTVITGDEGMCPPTGNKPGGWVEYTLVVKGACSEEAIMTIDGSGRLDSKSINITPNEPVASSFTLVNTFPNAEIPEEC